MAKSQKLMMEYILIIGILLVVIIVLKILIQAKLKKIKEIGTNENLNRITNNFPENVEIAKKILKSLNNETTKVKENDQNESSFYFVLTDTITIANIRNSYTRIQTIAHECIHSVQNKGILLFHNIYSHLYQLYFIALIILTAVGVVKNYLLQIIVLLILHSVFYMIRSYLEMDAMIKARYIAKEYMKQENIIKEDDQEKIINAYDKLNEKGIRLANYQYFIGGLVKVIIFCMEIILLQSFR